ncbi:GGDEF domain-containing protein, partial [Pseudoalteromonas sp. SIMBA_153]
QLFFYRPEMILVFCYTLAILIWYFGIDALTSHIILEPDVEYNLAQSKPWGIVALSIVSLILYARIWVLRLKKSRELLYKYLGNSPT